jgi:hypothetical protein
VSFSEVGFLLIAFQGEPDLLPLLLFHRVEISHAETRPGLLSHFLA